MQIKIEGEFTLAEIRQVIFEKLHELEIVFAATHSQGATLYITPTNGEGGDVVLHRQDGRVLSKIVCSGPYRSAANEYKL